MYINDAILGNDEKAVFNLRDLYIKYGYIRYRMSKFEKYDFYVDNKDFLVSDKVITFNDAGGLMALKPDVTLSIIKNIKDDGDVLKVYYNENVYRQTKKDAHFKEIMQTGLECIGNLSLYNKGEVIMLAQKSLACMSDEFILDISHMGMCDGLLDDAMCTDSEREAVLSCISGKNAHEIYNILGKRGEKIISLTELYGDGRSVIDKLEKLDINEKTANAIKEIKGIYEFLDSVGCTENVRFDFSVINDLNYYNGIVFQGFIKGVETKILSGGQYDRLLEKMGKKSGALGFAVYLDLVRKASSKDERYDTDFLIIADESHVNEAAMLAKEISDKGERVLVLSDMPKNTTYVELINLSKGENKNA